MTRKVYVIGMDGKLLTQSTIDVVDSHPNFLCYQNRLYKSYDIRHGAIEYRPAMAISLDDDDIAPKSPPRPEPKCSHGREINHLGIKAPVANTKWTDGQQVFRVRQGLLVLDTPYVGWLYRLHIPNEVMDFLPEFWGLPYLVC